MAAPDRAFADHCCELLSGVGPCVARRMFGGWGISTEGLNIAIIAWETLYLKASPETEAHWRAAGCEPFVYEAKGKAMQLRYYTAPAEAMDSPALMLPWARLALQAALAARKDKPRTAQGGLDSKRDKTRPRPATKNSP